uniref:Uncharacterized protein n=1 Tax=Vespula pensylvanica TaxID=30213 RepID=A0A834N8P8_VESPE|nr:hypothetical protein H0235_015657 [Vespula pensylvanica]
MELGGSPRERGSLKPKPLLVFALTRLIPASGYNRCNTAALWIKLLASQVPIDSSYIHVTKVRRSGVSRGAWNAEPVRILKKKNTRHTRGDIPEEKRYLFEETPSVDVRYPNRPEAIFSNEILRKSVEKELRNPRNTDVIKKRSGMELGRIGKEFPQYPWVLEAPCRSQRGFRRWMSVSHGSLSPRQTYPSREAEIAVVSDNPQGAPLFTAYRLMTRNPAASPLADDPASPSSVSQLISRDGRREKIVPFPITDLASSAKLVTGKDRNGIVSKRECRWTSDPRQGFKPQYAVIRYIRLVRLGYLKDDSQSPYLYDYCLLGSSSGSQAE